MSTKVHQRYRNRAGVVVPGVTTVIALLAKPALINWAWKQGLDGQDINKVRDKAGDIGTCVHHICEQFLKNQEPDLKDFTGDTIAQATPLAAKFKGWFAKEGMKVIASEAGVVSEAWQFGGTIDFVANREDATIGLYDIKTSKGIYDEYKIQLSAYKEAWDECHPDKAIQSIMVIHLDKETGDLSLHNFADLSVEFEIFKHLRAIYVLQKRVDPHRNAGASYRKKVKASNE